MGGTRDLSLGVFSAVCSDTKKSLIILIRPDLDLDLSESSGIITQKNSLHHIISQQQNAKIMILAPQLSQTQIEGASIVNL